MTIDTKPIIPAEGPVVADAAIDGKGKSKRGDVSIIVNGRRHVVGVAAIDYAEVVKLAFPATRSTSFVVTFREGPLDRATGFLVPGHGTPIVEDEVFHVAAAVQS